MRCMSRTVFGLILICGLAAIAAGCGGGSSSDSSSSTSGEDAAPLSGTVQIWDTNYESLPDYSKAVDQLDSEFEKQNPGVTVEREAQPLDSYEALLRSSFASHEGPDIMVMNPGALGVLSFTQGLEPLNDYISSEMNEQLQGWSAVTPGYTEEGTRYGVPVGLSGYAYYYNKKLFKQAGLPTDFNPKSWAELKKTGEKLKAAGIQPFTGGNSEGYENLLFFSAGFHSLMDDNPKAAEELAEGTLDFNEPVVAEAFEPNIEMEEAGLFPSDRFSTSLFSEGYPRFAEGKGAMTMGFWNTVGYWGEFNPKLGEKNVGVFLTPGPETVENTALFTYTIPKFAADKDAAWALIEFESSKKSMEVLDEGGLMPNRKDVPLPADAPEQERELVDASREHEIVPEPGTQVPSPVVYGPVTTGISEVLQGRISIEEAQEQMQEASEKVAH
jgi:ABC-type glycerol-3-phosphate transport system substrate-binding protein